jgi:uncharacterized membrane protein
MELFSKPFLNDAQKKAVVESIRLAELHTSGEIRIHIEASNGSLPLLDRAKEVFFEQKMHLTKERNGVLLYIAHEDKNIAILGDRAINDKMGEGYWEEILNSLKSSFKTGEYEQGLVIAVRELGEKLQRYFPGVHDGQNELTNEISEA